MKKAATSFTLTQGDIAAALAISQPQVSKDLREAGIESAPSGYSLGDLVKLAEWRALSGVGVASDGRAYDGDRERARLTAAQAVLTELKIAQLRKELAPINLIEWTLGRVGNQIGAIMDSVPLKVKKVVPRLTAIEIENIKRECVKAMNIASRITVNLDEYYDEAATDENH